ncbi:MAG: hypothetical protein ABIX01_21960 [Chitinophagaceae bacterium]
MKPVMKLNRLFAVLLFSGIFTSSFSQTLKEFFNDSEVPLTYLGVDFTKAKLLTQGDPDAIRDKHYTAINYVVINEPKKYDIKGAFHKSVVNTDIAAVNARNEKVNINEILSTNSADYNRLKESDIAAVVKGLDITGKQGVGLLFVMEAMRKVDKDADAAIWVTLIDMKTKKVLMTERIEKNDASGIGFRNYWAATIRRVIEAIDKKKFKEWRSKYGS